MKSVILGLGLMGLMIFSKSAEAQCGCGIHYAPITYVTPVYSAPVYSAPIAPPSQTISSVSYVNRLANPIDRGTYSLSYAVHLTNGRVLFTDYIPSGHIIRGTEANGIWRPQDECFGWRQRYGDHL